MNAVTHAFRYFFAVCVRETALVLDPPNSKSRELARSIIVIYDKAEVAKSRKRGSPVCSYRNMNKATMPGSFWTTFKAENHFEESRK